MGDCQKFNLINYNFSGEENFKVSNINDCTVTLKNENELQVTKSVQNETFNVGDTISFIVTIKNTGVGYFSGLRVLDNFGGVNYIEYVSGSGAIYKNGSIEKPETISCVPLVFSLTPLLPNESVILTYLCKVRNNIPLSVQNINSSVEVTGYTNNSAITNVASVIINRAKTAELKIVKSASATSVVSGEIFSYYLTIENEGLVDAEISKINDGLESGFKVLSVRIKSGDNKAVELKTGDYLIDGGNNILIEAKNGIEKIIVPARVGDTASKTIITITGYFEK